MVTVERRYAGLVLLCSIGFAVALGACGDDGENSPAPSGAAGAGGGSAGGGGASAGSGGAGSGGAGAGSAGAGSGGASAGSGGAGAGSGGASAGSGGAGAGSGGASAGSGGAGAGSGGASAGSGGAGAGSGGASAGSGGAGAGSGGAGGNAGASGAQSASANISAASGGKLVVGGATLLFGPKVVAADLTVTGSSSSSTSGLPRASELRGDIYEFGPSGAKFDKAVLIRLPLPGGVPSGKQWNVAWLDATAGKWVPLPTAITSDGAVSMTNHFTQFALLEQPLIDVAAGCNVAPACGGTLAPHYDLGAACFTGTPPQSGPLPFCPTGSLSQSDSHTSGLFDFDDATKGVYQAIVLGVFTKMDLEPACLTNLAAIVGGPVSTCADLETPLGNAFKAVLMCGGSVSTKCTCYAPSAFAESIHTGTYSTSGNVLTLTDAKGSVNTNYCVSGGVLDIDDGGNYKFKFTP